MKRLGTSIESWQKESIDLKKRTCGFISQHLWELPPLIAQGSNSKFPIRESLKACFLPLIEVQGMQHFLLSMERGIPLEATAALLELRELHPITVGCVIPFEEQHIDWPEEERDLYFNLIAQCNEEHLLQHHFSLDCYQKSIRFLLSHCEQMVVLWNGRASDAGDAVQLAQTKKRNLITVSAQDLGIQPELP